MEQSPVCDIGDWVQPLDSNGAPEYKVIQVIDMQWIESAKHGWIWVYGFREPYEHWRRDDEFIVQ